MAQRFSAEEALEYRGTDEAIILDAITAAFIMQQHATCLAEYLEDTGRPQDASHDAGDVFAWLGY